jgi:hypothetical protein
MIGKYHSCPVSGPLCVVKNDPPRKRAERAANADPDSGILRVAPNAEKPHASLGTPPPVTRCERGSWSNAVGVRSSQIGGSIRPGGFFTRGKSRNLRWPRPRTVPMSPPQPPAERHAGEGVGASKGDAASFRRMA